jgi:hypothetical protein
MRLAAVRELNGNEDVVSSRKEDGKKEKCSERRKTGIMR